MPRAHPAPASEIDVLGSARRRPRSSERVEERRTRVRQWLGHATTLRPLPAAAGDLALARRAAVEHSRHERRLAARVSSPAGADRSARRRAGGWPATVATTRPSKRRVRPASQPPPAFTAYTPYAPGMAQATSTNGLAIASMVLGILWLWWIGSILALVFGYVAKGQIDRSAGRQGGRGMAIAGIVLGWIGVGVARAVHRLRRRLRRRRRRLRRDQHRPVRRRLQRGPLLQDPDC